MVQRNVGTNAEEDIQPMLASVNLLEDELILVEASAIAQPRKIGPIQSFFSIPEEDVAIVKDSATFGLPAHRRAEGCKQVDEVDA